DVITRHRGVHDGVAAQVLGTRLGNEGEVGEVHAALGVRRLVLAAELGHARIVHLEEARHVRRRAARHDHVIRGDLADVRERLDTVAGPGLDGRVLDYGGPRGPGPGYRGLRRSLNEPKDILLRHPAGEPRTGNRRDVDLVLRRDLADQRRGAAPQALVGGLRPVTLPRRGGRAGRGGRGRRRGGRLRRCWSGRCCDRGALLGL